MTKMTLLQEIKHARKHARGLLNYPCKMTSGWEIRVMCGEGSSGSPDIFFEGTGRVSLKVIRREYELAKKAGYNEIWIEGRYDGCKSLYEWIELGEWQDVEYWNVDLTEENVYNKAAAVGSP